MVVTCEKCGAEYDDARHWTICPHREFLTSSQAAQKDLAFRLLRKLVRFAHEPEDSPGHRVTSIGATGMVTLHDMAGEFAPHLFVETR